MASLDTDINMLPAGEGSSGAGPSVNPKKPKRFEIKKWNAVALWAWGNCRSFFRSLSPRVSSVKPIKQVRQVKNVLSLGSSSAASPAFAAAELYRNYDRQ
ncbi:RING-box protein 1a [Nymphaea thermarum]|nr:RING-box protein 1a [Nymphaea thermarum]